MNTIGTLVIKFFHDYLAGERDVSPNTTASYSDCVRLLLGYAAGRLGVTPDNLDFESITDEIVLDFLDHLEAERENTAATRNQRLAAIKTFFRFLAHHQPTMLAACERVCAISPKKVQRKVMETLDHGEVRAIFKGIGSGTVHDARDRALLEMMYNTGARVQELLDLDADGFRMAAPAQVKLSGKGGRERIVPLREETVDSIERYLRMRREAGMGSDALFLNDRGERLTRHGALHIVKNRVEKAARLAPSLDGRKITPHTFRHTNALHMLQAGNDIAVVKDFLGHADIKTTSMYVEIDIEMKRKALESCPPPPPAGRKADTKPKWRKQSVMEFLHGLSRGPALC
jgi:site-specific recombinase XerD